MVGDKIVYTVVIEPKNHMIYGAKAISDIIKRSPDDIQDLVNNHGLVAWQDGQKGKWRALCSDLLSFNEAQRNKGVKK